MKKSILFPIFTILPLLASAEPVEIDGIWYNLVKNAQEAELTRNPNVDGWEAWISGNCDIPASVIYDGVTYSVTSIGNDAFCYCSELTSVTIPSSVTSIGGAFYDCSGLTSVHISDLKAWCGIEFSDSYIYSYYYPSNPLFYAHHLYLNGEEIKDLVVPSSVTSIGQSAFRGFSGLTSVTIPNSVTSIGDGAFSDCSGLTSITIQDGVTSIGNHAFSGCSALTSVHISDLKAWCGIEFSDSYSNPLNYANHLYLNGEEIKDLVIPSSVTSIGSEAFSGCSNLTSVTIPSSVTSIGSEAFKWCSGLTSITIPNSVTSIGDYAFFGCSDLTSITIPSSVTSIERSAFSDCSGLTSITIQDGVTSIGNYAFQSCTSLTSVTIPNSVTSIGDGAFSGCSGLTSVTIQDGVTSIGNHAFYGCSDLTSVTIPVSVTSIGSEAFSYCIDLADVYCMVEKIKSDKLSGEALYTHTSAFQSSYPQYITLHVPATAIETYRTTEPWGSFKNIVAIGDGEIPETQKCTTPVITYKEGKLSFACETKGAEFITEITGGAAKKYYDSEITVGSAYTVTVYATKPGYDDSEKATLIITPSGIQGDLTGDGKVDVADHVRLSEIIMKQ